MPPQDRHERALRCIRSHLARHGRSPSVRELASCMGFSSPRSAAVVIDELVAGGHLIKRNGKVTLAREMVDDSRGLPTVQVPIVGCAPCGAPFLAEENVEGYVHVDAKLARPSSRHFIVRAVGTSMNQAGIQDGDLVLVREAQDAQTGDRVVALDVNPKRTALRISDKKSGDLRIDVVPGRFVDDDQSDVYLHQSGGSKERLKTNPDKHIKHVADSGVRDVIKLTKVWRHRVDLQAKTFALELLVIKLLADRENDDLDTQFRSLLEAFRDDSDSLCVEDPANSNNDLTPLINEMRSSISSAAAGALAAVDRGGWESVFGPLVEKGDRAGRIAAVASTDTARVKPWAV